MMEQILHCLLFEATKKDLGLWPKSGKPSKLTLNNMTKNEFRIFAINSLTHDASNMKACKKPQTSGKAGPASIGVPTSLDRFGPTGSLSSGRGARFEIGIASSSSSSSSKAKKDFILLGSSTSGAGCGAAALGAALGAAVRRLMACGMSGLLPSRTIIACGAGRREARPWCGP